MKIKLNELRALVRSVIKEEVEKNPEEELNDEFRIFIENFNNVIVIKNQFNEFLNNKETDTKKFSNVSALIYNSLKKFKVLSDKISNMIRVEFKNMSSFSQTIPIMKIRLPEILEATLEVFPVLKKIYENSVNANELDNFVRNFQYGLLPFKMTIDRMLNLLSKIETVSPQQQNNVPQQQGNSPQSGVTENLKNINKQLNNLFFDFEKKYILYKKQYINDEISEKQFSTEISNYFPPMSRLVSQMENEIPINENSFKISIFKDSDFDNYFASLKKYVNTIDEAVLKGKTTNIAESINGIKRILDVFQQDLNIFSR